MEEKKENAIGIVQSFDCKIYPVNINISGKEWQIFEEGFVQPLSAIKGLGEKAVDNILSARPFQTIDEFLFNEKISYRQVNKKVIDALSRSGALDELIDKRFKGTKHFWASVAGVERPKTPEDFEEAIKIYESEGEFSKEERIFNIFSLTGVYPIHLVLEERFMKFFEEKGIPPISRSEGFAWFVVRDVVLKKTKKNNKDYLLLDILDNSGYNGKMKVWEVSKGVLPNSLYFAQNIDWSEKWGYSLRNKDLKRMTK